MCQIACAGLTSEGIACSGHVTCDTTGACLCLDSWSCAACAILLSTPQLSTPSTPPDSDSPAATGSGGTPAFSLTASVSPPSAHPPFVTARFTLTLPDGFTRWGTGARVHACACVRLIGAVLRHRAVSPRHARPVIRPVPGLRFRKPARHWAGAHMRAYTQRSPCHAHGLTPDSADTPS